MKIYKIFSKNNLDDIEITSEGFSFKAGLFNVFWALYRGHWPVAILYFIVLFVFLPFLPQDVITPTIFLVFGIFASELEEISFFFRGYKFSSVIVARDEEEAKYQYILQQDFDKNLDIKIEEDNDRYDNSRYNYY